MKTPILELSLILSSKSFQSLVEIIQPLNETGKIVNEIIQPLNETGQIVNVHIDQTTPNQSSTSHAKLVSQGNSSRVATVQNQVAPLSKQIQCNSSRTAKANDQVIPLPNQIQCKPSKTATANDTYASAKANRSSAG